MRGHLAGFGVSFRLEVLLMLIPAVLGGSAAAEEGMSATTMPSSPPGAAGRQSVDGFTLPRRNSLIASMMRRQTVLSYVSPLANSSSDRWAARPVTLDRNCATNEMPILQPSLTRGEGRHASRVASGLGVVARASCWLLLRRGGEWAGGEAAAGRWHPYLSRDVRRVP
jgi:hypothetical protein